MWDSPRSDWEWVSTFRTAPDEIIIIYWINRKVQISPILRQSIWNMRYILCNLEYKTRDRNVLGLIVFLHISIEGI